MENLPLKYIGYTTAFQEVPNETSLIFNISGCPHMCEGCHSQYLWEYEGKYVSDDIDSVIELYKGLITCVCFMGGDQNLLELKSLLQKCKENGFKTCLYSGLDDMHELDSLLELLDYIKIGSYKIKLGGLNSKTTNQRFYMKNSSGEFIDTTYVFQKH